MSRIEEALEKAAQLRGCAGGAAREGVQRQTPVDAGYIPPALAVQVEHPLLVTVKDPHSPVAEEYRKLKSAIVTLTRGKTFLNTIMVTSSIGGEGKSITALNLAITLAQEFDHSVLLVDADLRKPSLHTCLGIEPNGGLAGCLLDGIDPGDALIKTGIGKLTILPAGRTVKNPVELFSSQKMKDLVRELKERYPDRYIIIDTPPVLPFAETRTLCGYIEGVVFVVKNGEATLDNVTEALMALKGTPVLGVVYNEASMESLSGRYHNYYYDYDAAPKRESLGLSLRRFLPGFCCSKSKA